MLIGVVERNHTIRRLLQLVLEYEHHQVECLTHHQQRHEHAVLLIDPGTPQYGISVLDELEGTPTIILSTHDEYHRLCEAHHLPLLQKPFHVTYPRMNAAASTRLPALDPPGPKVLDAPNPE